MKKRNLALVLAGLGMMASGLLSGCANPAAADNPYHVESQRTEAHGEISASYGRSTGH